MATLSLKLLRAKLTPTAPMIPGKALWRRPGCKRLVFLLLFPSHSPPQESEGWEGGK